MDRSRASSTGAHSTMTAGSGMTAGSDATRHAYLMHAHRRRPPPRFRPYMIIILVLSVGLLLIGLTMTIIGLWPSYSPSGGNPLQIVGPLMLGMGMLGLSGSIANICYKREQEKKQMMKSISDMRSSRLTIASQHPSQQMTPTPSVHARPSKGILKSSSTATSVNGTVKGSENESDSGMANTHSFQSNRSYERDSNSSDMSRNLDNIKVEMNPDPTAYRHGKPVDQSSTGSDQGIPPASMGATRSYHNQQRHHAPKQSRHTKPQSQYSNQGYSPDTRETDIDGDLTGAQQQQQQHHRQMQDYGYSGYDVYDQGAGIAGAGGLTGGGALGSPGSALGSSPYGTPQAARPPVVRQPHPQQAQMQQAMAATQQQQQQPQQARTRWGSKSPRSPQPTEGQLNASYTQDVSTVSAQYQQAQQQYATPSGNGGGHYTSYAHSGGAVPVPSSSTEV